MKRFACLAIPFALAACGDNLSGTTPIDAADNTDSAVVIDAAVDAPPIDAPIDAPAVTYGGTVSLLEAAVLNPGTSGTFFGQGVQVGISFSGSDQVPGPVLEEAPGSPLGCKAWVYTRQQAIDASVGLDQGPIQINSPAGAPTALLPACVFTAGVGYSCPEVSTQSTGGTIAAIPAGPLAGFPSLTDLDTMFTVANSTNRYVRISGATNAANNGVFPILAVAGANTIAYGNPAFVAETIPATGGHINLAGVGPTPSAADPGFLADVASVDFVHAAGANIPAFTATTGVAGSVGDDFTLDIADANLLNALPADGSEFTVSCGTGSCASGSATGSILNIVATDTTPGASPFDMPLPTTERVAIRCAAVGPAANSITIPAAYSAYLMRPGIKRIQATFIRATLMGQSAPTVTAISGHAIVGFTNRN
ncbi:MAG: hypothetical protein R3B06_13095 [Kofleriaceae bacterium]